MGIEHMKCDCNDWGPEFLNFYLIIINLNGSSHLLLMSVILDGMALECKMLKVRNYNP